MRARKSRFPGRVRATARPASARRRNGRGKAHRVASVCGNGFRGEAVGLYCPLTSLQRRGIRL